MACRRRTSADTVDDVVADTYLTVWRKIDQVPAGDGCLPWLYGVAYRVLSHQYRGSFRHVHQERPEHGTLTFLIEGSRVGSVAREWDQEASRWIAGGDPVIHYLQWLNRNHPDWDEGLTWMGEPGPIG